MTFILSLIPYSGLALKALHFFTIIFHPFLSSRSQCDSEQGTKQRIIYVERGAILERSGLTKEAQEASTIKTRLAVCRRRYVQILRTTTQQRDNLVDSSIQKHSVVNFTILLHIFGKYPHAAYPFMLISSILYTHRRG